MCEVKKFLGLTLAMALIRKATIDSYWSTEPLMQTAYFNSCMSRDRYRQILKFLRFSNPYDVSSDKNSRISGMDKMCSEINKCFLPGKSLSLDESLLLHKGRLSFRMFIQTKRARFGIKIYMLCDSSGYMICSEVYYGASTHLQCNESGFDELSKSEQVIVALLSKCNFLDKGYTVTLDNWYTSTRVAEYLWKRKTAIRGTIRVSRGVPQELREKTLRNFQCAYMRKNELLCIKFSDKKDVYLLSTADNAGEIERQRTFRGGHKQSYQKPEAIHTYNTEMSGVDLTDQYISSCNIVRKSQVWFKKIGLSYFQRLVLNSFIRFRIERNQKMHFGDFMKAVVCHLTGVPSQSQKTRHRRASSILSDHHYPEEIPTQPGQPRRRRKCAECAKTKTRKDTYYFCPSCPDTPALCVVPCFRNFHVN